jgi:uncharacterized protein YdbL (DUF1318 family)
MKSRLLPLLVLIGIFAAVPAFALDLQSAALVADVNAKRKQEYARISKEKGQPVDVIAKLAAEEIINGLAPGSSYQGTDGGWKKR